LIGQWQLLAGNITLNQNANHVTRKLSLQAEVVSATVVVVSGSVVVVTATVVSSVKENMKTITAI